MVTLNEKMKRNENIVQLSRDHHFGLLCSWKIRQGLKKEIEIFRIKNYVEYFWNAHLQEHFQKEENVLFPYIQDEFSAQVKFEHQEIAHLVAYISTNADDESLSDFADLLEKHIRFEERTWFPHLENQLSAEDLNYIGKALNEIHANEKDDYTDEFWK